jgi:hypothetical protein
MFISVYAKAWIEDLVTKSQHYFHPGNGLLIHCVIKKYKELKKKSKAGYGSLQQLC